MANWTTEHLKILFEQRFEDHERAVAAALAATKEAILKAETAAERRFESVNEFRATLSDQAAHLMPRTEAQVEFKALRENLASLAVRMERAEGKGAGIAAGWGYLVGLVGLLAAIAGLASRFLH